MTESPTLPQVSNLTLMRYVSKRTGRMVQVWRSGSLSELRVIAKTYTLKGPGWSIRWSVDGLTGFVYSHDHRSDNGATRRFESIVTLTPGRF